MNKFCSILVIVTVLCWMANLVSCEAKIDAKPGEAERNFQLLKRKMKIDQDKHANIIADNNDLEGSGDDYEDDDDYDEDEYDYDDDDYYDDDDDDIEEGSGDLLFGTEQDTNVILNPDSQDDFHFVDDMHANKKPSEASDDDLLYEYYNDLLYGEKDDDYYEELKEDLGKDFDRQDQETFIVDDVIEIPVENPSSGYVFRPAYIFLMLASALVSFAFFTLIFILCRKSMLERHNKQKLVPFVVSTSGSGFTKSSPIVKNYQRVPTSTKEMMKQQPQSTVEMGLNSDTQKPLLT